MINILVLKLRGDPGTPSFFDDSADSAAEVLKYAGLQVTRSTNRVVVDAVNIVWGAGTHAAPDLAELRRYLPFERTILFNMEQIEASHLVNENYLDLLSDYRSLDANRHNLEALRRRRPSAQCEEFPILPVPALSNWGNRPAGPYVDVAFSGAMSERRHRVIESLRGRGLSVAHIQGNFGENLSAALANARLVINMHVYEEAKIFEVARVLRPMAMGIPVVSEHSLLPSNVSWVESGIRWTSIEAMADVCEKLLQDNQALQLQSRMQLAFLGRADVAGAARTALTALAS